MNHRSHKEEQKGGGSRAQPHTSDPPFTSCDAKEYLSMNGKILYVKLSWKSFRGDTCLEDDERSGRPRTIDDDELLRAVTANPEATTRELAVTLGCSHATIENFLQRHGYRKVLSR
ncbi:hypothetical protein OSTOST_16394, partial [Ostertagia ostertagi]